MLNLCTTTTSHIQLKPYMVTRENVLAAANVSYRKGKSAAHVWTKALAAAERNDITTLNKLWGMPEGKFITRNFQGENGHILHYAAKRVKAKSVAWLLEHGADVNAVDREGEVGFLLHHWLLISFSQHIICLIRAAMDSLGRLTLIMPPFPCGLLPRRLCAGAQPSPLSPAAQEYF